MLCSSVVLAYVLWSCKLQVQLFQTSCVLLQKSRNHALSLSLASSLPGVCFLTLLCSVWEKNSRGEGEVGDGDMAKSQKKKAKK